MQKGILSRKFLIAITTTIIDLLALTKVIPTEATGQEIVLINSISALYITIEGIIDAIKK